MAQLPRHRRAIVETAVRLFRKQGYAATGLNQIVEESGAPKGSLYHYFPDGKLAIAAEAVRLAGETVQRTLTELAEQNARLVEAVQLLRVRTRMVMVVTALLALGLVVLFVR